MGERLKQRIAQNNAEIEPLIADVANVTYMQDEFLQVIRRECERTVVRVKTRKEETKREEQIEDSEVQSLKSEK